MKLRNTGLSLRARFLVVFLLIFMGGALAGYGAISWVSRDLITTLSSWYAEKSVLYEKARVLQLLLREVALTQKMAGSPALKSWVRAENDGRLQENATVELEDYRRFFGSNSYFLVVAGSGNYYFNDGSGTHDPARPRYTLSADNPKDAWFYETLRRVGDYELNVNIDRHLQVTRVWINAVIRDGGRPLAVVGTGLDLSEFIRNVVTSAPTGVTNMIVNRDGAIQAHHDVSVIDFGSIAKQREPETQSTIFNLLDDSNQHGVLKGVFAALASGKADQRAFPLTIQGKVHTAAVTYLPEFKWFLVTLTHPDSVRDHRYVKGGIVAILVALALVLLLAGLMFDRVVLRRLRELDAATQQIASGNYSIDLMPQGNDELSRLRSAFRKMADQIAAHTRDLERQVSERTRALEHMAYADLLTGLLNRRGMIARLDVERNRMQRQKGRIGVMLLDLDHFKKVNDRYGHDIGDKVLEQLAETMRQVMRSYDLCARWGGEEFLIAAPNIVDEAALKEIAEKLRLKIAATPLATDQGAVAVTVSIGCCLADPELSIDAMVKSADDALYVAKRRRNVVVMGSAVDEGGPSGSGPKTVERIATRR